MQIKGEEFIKKVQLQQEREELERKLSELEEVEVSISDNIQNNIIEEPVHINNNNNKPFETNEHELDNIMLDDSNVNNNEENKKKYLILGIVLVVLFLLTIIIIRLLTGDSTKEDQFTSNANSSEIKRLSENNNIEENFQKIINDRVKKEVNEPMIPENAILNEQRLNNIQQINEDENTEERETFQEEAPIDISNETMDETIRKIEEKKVNTTNKKVVEKAPIKEKKVEQKKSVKDLMSNTSSKVVKGYFVQVGAFTKKPSDSYINTIRNAKFKYKIYQHEVKGVVYNKVLIGPYSSRGAASENIDFIKQKLNLSSAFIVKF